MSHNPMTQPTIAEVKAAIAKMEDSRQWLADSPVGHPTEIRVAAFSRDREAAASLALGYCRASVAGWVLTVPTKPRMGRCENKRKPGGCPLHNLQCSYPKCDEYPANADAGGAGECG